MLNTSLKDKIHGHAIIMDGRCVPARSGAFETPFASTPTLKIEFTEGFQRQHWSLKTSRWHVEIKTALLLPSSGGRVQCWFCFSSGWEWWRSPAGANGQPARSLPAHTRTCWRPSQSSLPMCWYLSGLPWMADCTTCSQQRGKTCTDESQASFELEHERNGRRSLALPVALRPTLDASGGDLRADNAAATKTENKRSWDFSERGLFSLFFSQWKINI